MQGGQRHFARTREEQLVAGHAVDLLLGVRQHAGSEQRLLAHQDRRDHRGKALPLEQGQGPLNERQLQAHERPLEVGEARSRHARARLHVEVLTEQLHVVAPAAPGLALLAQDLVLEGRRGVGQVRQQGQRGGAALLHRAQLLGELLLARRGALHLGDRRAGVLARALQLADALGGLVLGAPQLLELGQQRTPALVGIERLIEHRGVEAAPKQRLSRRCGVFTDLPEVEHRPLEGSSSPGLVLTRTGDQSRPRPSTWTGSRPEPRRRLPPRCSRA